MDTSIFATDMTAWISSTSEYLYFASVGLAVVVIALVGCMVGQNASQPGHASKKRSPLAH
jgi:hypothetical protein